MPNPPPIEILVTIPFTDAQLDNLRNLSPRIRVTSQPARRPEDISAEVWERTEVLYTDRILPDPALVPNLRWLQFHFAGVDFALDSPLLRKPDLQVTTLSGAAAPQMAEYALSMMLVLGHQLPALSLNQTRAEWPRARWDRFSPRELRGSTVGLIGYGSIGREIARLLHPWNCTVLAVKRDVMHPQDLDYIPPGMGDPDGEYFTRLYPVQAVCSVMKECDFVVVSLPLTPQTRGLIGEPELAVMKSTAYLIHIGRGGVVAESALLDALQNKRLAGAVLDVFGEEPLPPTSPFWRLPNALVTPHVGGISRFYADRAMDMLMENLQRYLSGGVLLNRFDLERGY